MGDNFRDYLGAIRKWNMIGWGSYSDVYLCDYLDAGFAYKEYIKDDYVKFIKDKLYRIVEIGESPNMLLPYKFIYKKPEDEYFKGYVIEMLYYYDKLCDIKKLTNDKKIELLKRARVIIDNFHNKYNSIHTDLSPWNLLYSKSSDDLMLIDFDSNISLEKKDVIDLKKYNIFAESYMKYVGVDKDVDMYLFNLCVFSIMNDVHYYSCLDEIANGEFGLFEDNEKIKNIFASYKDLSCKKSLKKEYVIDYM